MSPFLTHGSKQASSLKRKILGMTLNMNSSTVYHIHQTDNLQNRFLDSTDNQFY